MDIHIENTFIRGYHLSGAGIPKTKKSYKHENNKKHATMQLGNKQIESRLKFRFPKSEWGGGNLNLDGCGWGLRN